MNSLRRALAALAIIAFLAGIGAAALILTSDHTSSRGLAAAVIVTAGWSFVGTGLYAWGRRPDNAIGPLMTAIGFTWLFQGLESSNDSVVFAIGVIGATVPYAILIHLLVSFPSGRLQSGFQRLVVGVGYLTTTVLQLGWALFVDPTTQANCENCPENPILIGGHPGLADAIADLQLVLGIFAIAATIGILFVRWRGSSTAQRRALTPVVISGGLAFLILLARLVLTKTGVPQAVKDVTYASAIVVFASLPFAFLLGLLRSRIGRDEEIRTALSAENEQLNQELRAKVEELRASRARIVEAGYAERRRVERDLHDGAQQRLMALTMTLRLARGKLGAEPGAAAELLDEAMEELAAASAELRELARGIHPVVLTDRGLAAALAGLADRSPVPVRIVRTPSERLPAPVESATYFVVAEALTNVARYAEADGASVRVGRESGVVEIEVRDDGVGGADLDAGTGLRGLEDRVAALEGTFSVRSPARRGDDRRSEDPVRVIVADDSTLLREGLVRLLEEAGLEVVGQAGDGADLLRKVRAHKPDIAIVDVRMPPTHTDEGLRAARRSVPSCPRSRLLVLSQYVEVAYARELLAESAEGARLPAQGPGGRRRRADRRGATRRRRRLRARPRGGLPACSAAAVTRTRSSELTPREREVMALMAEGRSNAAIAAELVVTERAVEKHVTSIFSKLELEPSSEDHRRVLAVLRFLDQDG